MVATIMELATGQLIECNVKYNSTDGNPIPHATEHLESTYFIFLQTF